MRVESFLIDKKIVYIVVYDNKLQSCSKKKRIWSDFFNNANLVV